MKEERDTIQTNRELYVAIAKLIEREQQSARTLEEYLLALWKLTYSYHGQPSLSLTEFFKLLSEAFTAVIPMFDNNWKIQFNEEDDDNTVGFEGWQATILRQIIDLHEMKEHRILDNEYRYFGVDSPRGQQWYNFDPHSFIECAMEGTYGGWQPGDSTGRDYVPGQAAVLTDEGKIESCDPRDIKSPIFEIKWVSWEDFQNFLLMGQLYE